MDILDFDNYFISQDGWVLGPSGKFLKFDYNRTGYKRVTLSKFGRVKRVFVHRLVATYYVENPNSYPIVNHKDGDKTNNHYTNLEWATHKKNLKHALETGLRDMNNVSRMCETKKSFLLKYLEMGWTYQRVADKLGVTYNAVAMSVRKV